MPPTCPRPTASRQVRHRGRLTVTALLTAALSAPFQGTQAQTSAPAEAPTLRALAASCAACHGTDGRALPDSSVPGLAGERASRLNALLLQFKRGERPATVMQQIAKGFSDAQIEALAGYFSRRPR